MELVELFKDALSYPTRSIDKWLILGVLFVATSLSEILNGFGFLSGEGLEFIFDILGLLFVIIAWGYLLSITRNTIHNVYEDAPEFDLGKNIVDGIKRFVLTIVYIIIPCLVLFVLAVVTGVFNYLIKLVPYISNGSINSVLESLIYSTQSTVGFGFIILLLVVLILFIVFGLLLIIAEAVLADTGSLTAACNIPAVFKKVGEIGWGNYILWIIVLFVILLIIALFAGVVSPIPFIGLLIVNLVIMAFEYIFTSRALGLIYNESKNESKI